MIIYIIMGLGSFKGSCPPVRIVLARGLISTNPDHSWLKLNYFKLRPDNTKSTSSNKIPFHVQHKHTLTSTK